jgi:hypothetical protein
METSLPDLFRFDSGGVVRTANDWQVRRSELLEHILRIEYGPLPSAAPVTAELLNEHHVRRYQEAHHQQFHLRSAAKQWVLDLLIPAGTKPMPVILNGDGCWRYLSDTVTMEILQRGYILAEFNRTEITPDTRGNSCAIASWAWSYHRCVDFLLTLPEVDTQKIAVAGHSRGGKTSLLAGATDGRIALVGDNASGCGGGAPFRSPPPDAETLAIITDRFPHWFSPRLREFAGRENELPFDQHALIAAIAPRALLNTMALGDRWANPAGAYQIHRAARAVWKLFGARDRIGISFRPGPHEHSREDWLAFLDFADWHLRGIPPKRSFQPESFGG